MAAPGEGNLLERLRRFLFDFSAGEENYRQVETILRAALAESETDGDFDAALRRVLKARDEPSRYHDFLYLMRRVSSEGDLDESLKVGRELRDGVGSRSQAMRLLDDLPRLYGIKNREAL